MHTGPARTAFQAFPALEHKNPQSVITTLAVNQAGDRIYLGLSDGLLEEHRVSSGRNGLRVVLGARKHVGKQPVRAIVCLHGVSRLAVLCDGLLQLLDQDTLEGQVVPGLKAVTAIEAEAVTSSAPSLAVAVRTGRRSARIMLYEVLAGGNGSARFGSAAMCTGQCEVAEPSPILGLAWLGERLVLCTAGRYMLLQLTPPGSYQLLFALPPDNPHPALVHGMGSVSGQALLLMDQVGLMINTDGQPTRSAFTFPSTPSAITTAGYYTLAVCREGMHVYDSSTAGWVQSLPYPDAVPLHPQEQLRAASAGRGSLVAVAGLRKAWAFVPVALEGQAAELLRAGQYEQALRLASAAAADGAGWADAAFAQAGLLLMHEMRWAEAVEALSRCRPDTWQPAQLFSLFPDACAAWRDAVPPRSYWRLAPPLAPLEALVSAFVHRLERRNASRGSLSRKGSSVAGSDAETSGSTSSSMLTGASAEGNKPGALLEGKPLGSLLEGKPVGIPSMPQLLQRLSVTEGLSEDVLAMDAKRCIANYLLRARGGPEVRALDGIDTLIVHLLVDLDAAGRAHSVRPVLQARTAGHPTDGTRVGAGAAPPVAGDSAPGMHRSRPGSTSSIVSQALVDLDAAGELERFASSETNAVQVDLVVPVLSQRGRFHALALLCMRHGRAEQALQLWKDLADGTKQEALSDTAEIFAAQPGAAAGVAVRHAAQLMADPARTDPALALRFLPWLLTVSSRHSLRTLQAREDLDPERALALLRPLPGQLLRRFLEHLVLERGSPNGQHHTELAVVLSDAALRLLPVAAGEAAAVPGAGSDSAAAGPSTDADDAVGRTTAMPSHDAGGETAAASAGDTESCAAELQSTRATLQRHLVESGRYNIGTLLAKLRGSRLWDEQVILHNKVGNHMAAVRVLALVMGDIRRAEAYCAAHTVGQDGYMGLLHMLLHPDDGRPPLYDEACHLLATPGVDLDPMQVVEALSGDIPAAAAATVLARMLRNQLHRRRNAAIVRNLWRAHNLDAAVERAELMSRRIVVTEERACRLCHTRIGTKMFAAYPNGVLVCFKCFRRGQPHVCPLTGRDFSLESGGAPLLLPESSGASQEGGSSTSPARLVLL